MSAAARCTASSRVTLAKLLDLTGAFMAGGSSLRLLF